VTERQAPASLALRVVLDTNTVVSALVLRSTAMRPVMLLWQQRRIQPVVSKPMVQELMRVLAYPKFRLTELEIESLLADYLPYCEVVQVEGHFNTLHVATCRDPKDQMFLNAAQIADVRYLVTGDAELHAVNDPQCTHHRFQICKAADLLAQFDSSSA
jgi:uncharacterized protein